jgi:hypothetical protein
MATYFHLTEWKNLEVIVQSNKLKASDLAVKTYDAVFGKGVYFTASNPTQVPWHDILMDNWQNTQYEASHNVCLEFKLPFLLRPCDGRKAVFLLADKHLEDLSQYLVGVRVLGASLKAIQGKCASLVPVAGKELVKELCYCALKAGKWVDKACINIFVAAQDMDRPQQAPEKEGAAKGEEGTKRKNDIAPGQRGLKSWKRLGWGEGGGGGDREGGSEKRKKPRTPGRNRRGERNVGK